MKTIEEKPFFLFGMGAREKLFYRNGALVSCSDGSAVFQTETLGETILAPEYTVRMETKKGVVTVIEDEAGVHLTEETGAHRTLTASPVRLPDFAGHPYRDALRILHHDILINIIGGKPVPNFFVYKKPWYRDGAMMTMVLEKTGNLALIRDWAAALDALYDRNNAGIEESDNLGQLLYILAKTGNTDHPLIPKAVEEAKHRSVNGALTGLSDFSEHPVYQTKWLKLGLEALGLDADWVKVPAVPDSYSPLFWMDGHKEEHAYSSYCENYPYLSWAAAHTAGFTMDKEHLAALEKPGYPISSETEASQAQYELLRPFLPAYADAHHSAPHTWHAAEMFLYLTDLYGI